MIVIFIIIITIIAILLQYYHNNSSPDNDKNADDDNINDDNNNNDDDDGDDNNMPVIYRIAVVVDDGDDDINARYDDNDDDSTCMVAKWLHICRNPTNRVSSRVLAEQQRGRIYTLSESGSLPSFREIPIHIVSSSSSVFDVMVALTGSVPSPMSAVDVRNKSSADPQSFVMRDTQVGHICCLAWW